MAKSTRHTTSCTDKTLSPQEREAFKIILKDLAKVFINKELEKL